MVDIHCHILPGIDDGSDNWDTTKKMCQMAVRDGITHIVATPHCDGHYVYDRDHFTDMLATLSDVSQGRLTFSIGCDFHLSEDNIEAAMNDPRPYALGDTQYLMVEFEHHSIPKNADELLLVLLSRGMVPIITHPERNGFLMKNLDVVRKFNEMGCLTQITANALTGFWGPNSQKAAEKMLDKKMVHIVATDAHDLNARPPILSIARTRVATKVGAEVAEALFVHNPGAVVAGRRVA